MVIWNPWHGCHKKSLGCLNCYMYRRDAKYDLDSNIVRKTMKQAGKANINTGDTLN